MDDERNRAARYSRTRELLFIAAMVWGWLVQALVFWSGWSAALARLARRGPGRRAWVGDVVYVLLLGALAGLADLPLAYVRDYRVEHQYGLSTQGRAGWLADVGKKTVLGLAFEAPMTAVAYATIRRWPRWWWLVLSALALPFTVILSQLYPVLIAPIFNKFIPLPDRALAERVRALAERAGVPVAEVTQMDMSRQTRKANAFFAGLGPTKRIALGDTLVEQFSPDEVEVIVAHELAHQVHRDVWKGIALGSIFTLGGAYALARLAPPLAHRLRDRTSVATIDDVASAPLLALLLGVVSALAMPVANTFTRRAIERPADRYAIELTDRPEAFISGMEKLARLNLTDPDPPALVKVLLHSHPTVAERIAMARAYAARRSAAVGA